MLKSRLGVERHQIGYPSGMVAALNGHSQFQGDYIVEISESGKIKQPVFPAYNVSWDDVRNALIYESKAYKVGDSISLRAVASQAILTIRKRITCIYQNARTARYLSLPDNKTDVY